LLELIKTIAIDVKSARFFRFEKSNKKLLKKIEDLNLKTDNQFLDNKFPKSKLIVLYFFK
jgi:hypothetical protein